jgi:hypothetical protein
LPNAELTYRQELFNKAQQHRRARVERYFSTLQRHSFMQGCTLYSEAALKARFVLWNCEILAYKLNTTDPVHISGEWASREVCECNPLRREQKPHLTSRPACTKRTRSSTLHVTKRRCYDNTLTPCERPTTRRRSK